MSPSEMNSVAEIFFWTCRRSAERVDLGRQTVRVDDAGWVSMSQANRAPNLIMDRPARRWELSMYGSCGEFGSEVSAHKASSRAPRTGDTKES